MTPISTETRHFPKASGLLQNFRSHLSVVSKFQSLTFCFEKPNTIQRIRRQTKAARILFLVCCSASGQSSIASWTSEGRFRHFLRIWVLTSPRKMSEHHTITKKVGQIFHIRSTIDQIFNIFHWQRFHGTVYSLADWLAGWPFPPFETI